MFKIKTIICLLLIIYQPEFICLTIGQTVSGYALVLQSDQKSLLAGNSFNNGVSSIIVARYNTDGTLDATYGQSGAAVVTIPNASNQYSYGMAIQSDNKVVVVGNCIINGSSSAVVIRLTTDGVLDSTFGINGNGIVVITLDMDTSSKSVVIQSDGKIIIGGSYINDLVQVMLVRLNSDGSLDTTFGVNGYTITPLVSNALVSTISLQTSSKIVVSGTLQGDHFMVRYNADGSVDTTFGSSGSVITSLNNQSVMYAMAINSSDKIFAGGYLNNQGVILKYSVDGALDATFANNGVFIFSSGPVALIFDLFCLTGDTVLFAGASGGLAMVGKVIDPGQLDTTFASNGIMRLTQGVDDSIAYSIQEQNDGKFLAGGLLCRECLVFRFDSNGSLDTSFDTKGFITEPSGDPCKVTAALAQ